MTDLIPADERKAQLQDAMLASIYARRNHRKASAYWLGFLNGVLASEKVEMAEYGPLHAEAENFLKLLHDPDAHELIDDLRIWKDEPDEIFEILRCIVSVRSRDFVNVSDVDEVNELYGFCAGIACDNRISVREVKKLILKLEKYPGGRIDRRIESVREAALRSISDGRITSEESDDICRWITHLVGDSASDTGLGTYGNVGVLPGALENHEVISFEHRSFVLTGSFKCAPRKVIQARIQELGGKIQPEVRLSTNYLCIAAEASRDWIQSHEGTKIRDAMNLRSRGEGPDLVPEAILSRALGM